MKIKGKKYEILRDAFAASAAVMGVDLMLDLPPRSLWLIWWPAYNSLSYDDDHPYFKDGQWKRVCPRNPEFRLVDDDTKDEHIESALKAIAMELRDKIARLSKGPTHYARDAH